ncbi:MAG: acetyl-CoA acetyltransferase [Holophagales bacterium]|nr:acetyl-CoA acetyltransferase [Holophagales bacterium]MYF95422.1 acetyl-CoA acetyltransferase [Holophagales bacterium]
MTQRTPVLVGLSQVLQRADDPAAARPPIDLMVEAVREAVEDAETSGLRGRVDSVRAMKGVWGYRNPALRITEALDMPGAETGLSVVSGNQVQAVFNQSALDIQNGRREAIVLCSAECGRTMGRAAKANLELDWLEDDDPPHLPDASYGDTRWTRHEMEMNRGIQQAVQYYSLFEIALRWRNGETVEGHRARIAELWAGFNRVAQGNPNAWIRKPLTAGDIGTVSPANRAVTYPYTKLMNANMRVDMAAALVLCSLDLARSLGVPESKMIFPLSGTDAVDHYFVSERDNLHSSPAIRLAGRRALALAGVEVADLDFIDVYSCFPSAVQIAARELGLDLERPLSVTGGLTFGGGPLNSYVMHSIARTAELLRDRDGGRALVTANGGMLTKHSFGVYSTDEPATPYRHEDLTAEVHALPRREAATEYAGAAEIESYTVMFGGAAKATKSFRSVYGNRAAPTTEPSVAHLACRLPDGRRAWANVDDPDTLSAMCEQEFCGRPVRIDVAGGAVCQ